MVTANIRRTRDLGDLASNYHPQQIEDAPPVDIPHSSIPAALHQYETFLDYLDNGGNDMDLPDDVFNCYLRENVKDILTVEEIAAFLNAAIIYDDHEAYNEDEKESYPLLFFSQLIQNSYEAGYNNFVLPMDNLQRKYSLAQELHGTADNPLRITIEGDVDKACGAYCSYINLTVIGNAGELLGARSVDSLFTTTGNVQHGGYDSKRSTFIIGGDAIEEPGAGPREFGGCAAAPRPADLGQQVLP